MDVPVNIFVGSPVWVKDPDLGGSVYGEIFWIDKSKVYVHTSNGKTIIEHFTKVSPMEFSDTKEFLDSHEEPSIISPRHVEKLIVDIVQPKPNTGGTESSIQKLFLAMCISRDLGFSNGIPVTSRVVYECLVQWGSFEDENTLIFDQIRKEISSQIIEAGESKDELAYWLSNLNTLLVLVIGAAKKFKTKFPASNFRQILVITLENTYTTIRNNIKTELSRVISQAPRTSKEITVVGSSSSHSSTDSSEETSIQPLQNIKKIMDNSLEILKTKHVPQFLVSKLFTQLFAFINVQLFNSILSNAELCSFSYAENVKSCLDELELWCYDAKENASSAKLELKHIKQAADILILKDKPKANFTNITRNLCPDLNLKQLYHLCTMYNDERRPNNNFSLDVLASLPQTSISDCYLPKDYSRISFSMSDISGSMENIDQGDIDLSEFIRANPKLVMDLL